MTKAFKLIEKYAAFEEGAVVYKNANYDYGLAADDTACFGERYISVTLKSDGDYPYQTVPASKLKEI